MIENPRQIKQSIYNIYLYIRCITHTYIHIFIHTHLKKNEKPQRKYQRIKEQPKLRKWKAILVEKQVNPKLSFSMFQHRLGKRCCEQLKRHGLCNHTWRATSSECSLSIYKRALDKRKDAKYNKCRCCHRKTRRHCKRLSCAAEDALAAVLLDRRRHVIGSIMFENTAETFADA